MFRTCSLIIVHVHERVSKRSLSARLDLIFE